MFKRKIIKTSSKKHALGLARFFVRQVWPSSRAFATHLASQWPHPHAAARVLELGAGLGLLGLAAAKLWQAEMVLSDLEDPMPPRPRMPARQVEHEGECRRERMGRT